MHVQFIGPYSEFTIANAHTMTGETLKKKLFEKDRIAGNTVYLMFHGSVIANDETPSKFGAEDGDELIAFVEEPVNEESVVPCRSAVSKSSFEPRFLSSRAHSTPSASVKSTVGEPVKTESDVDYADRMMASGVYRAPLIEVANHPCLKSLFLSKLKNSDNKLYNIINRNQQLLDKYVQSASTSPAVAGQQAAFVLIDDKANQDVMTIMEFASIEYEQALQEYLNYNMNLEQWSTNYFQWRVC